MTSATQAPLKDLKEGLTSARKPDITQVRSPFKYYTARSSEYGNFKYVRANYLRPVAAGGYTGVPTRADFERLRSYMRAAASHLDQTLDAMELHLSLDPDLLDVEGMRRAAYATDVDEDTTGKVGPSFMPHIAPACASLNMAISQAVLAGLLPLDPGQPWRDAKCASPYAEEARAAWRSTDAGKKVAAAADSAFLTRQLDAIRDGMVKKLDVEAHAVQPVTIQALKLGATVGVTALRYHANSRCSPIGDCPVCTEPDSTYGAEYPSGVRL